MSDATTPAARTARALQELRADAYIARRFRHQLREVEAAIAARVPRSKEWHEPYRRLCDIGQDVHQVAPPKGDEMVEQLRLLRMALTVASEPVVTTEMVREAIAHCPIELENTSTAIPRWEWLAEFLTRALAEPNRPCECCGVTPAGDMTAWPPGTIP